MIIVIDGPAGSGKSSTAKAIAEILDIEYLDSGALYRAVTYVWLEQGKPGFETFFNILADANLETRYRNQTFYVYINGEDITREIRTSRVAEHVSDVASNPEARSFVNRYMRSLVTSGIYIADGRDLGSAVFPDADLKFYMDASLDERAKRRHVELNDLQDDVSFEEVRDNLRKRDTLDSNRQADPLKKEKDAVSIDTTDITFEEQIEMMVNIIRERLELKS
jgi:cytidylate kinase